MTMTLKFDYKHKLESVLENETQKNSQELRRHRLPNHGQKTRIAVINKKRTCQVVDFAFPADHRVDTKESKKLATKYSMIVLSTIQTRMTLQKNIGIRA